MAVTLNVNPRLAKLTAVGTSVWLDQIRRAMIDAGELQRLIDEDSLRGVTSNPAIFEQAILGSPDYDQPLAEMARAGADPLEIYRALAVEDIQRAADLLRPVWESSGGADGFVSIEVAPRLAHDTDGTLEAARMFWDRVARPNAMIKIPGTEEGVPAIEQAVYEGINVNVTLLFSVAAYERVAEAFIRGLERRHAEGGSLDVHSVASFFVSRVDTEVDRRLAAVGRPHLQGTAALANARAAYRRFKQIFEGGRFEKLRAAGAAPQRPLWASTGVKNPSYPDTMYVDGLIGPSTVNTMPLPTLLAFAEHGNVAGPTAELDPAAELEALAAAGIDLGDVTAKLLADGIDSFQVAMERLLAGVDERRQAALTGRPPVLSAHLPAALEEPVGSRVATAGAARVAARIWRRDATLWGEEGAPEISDRLGWLTVSDPMLEQAPELHRFADACRADGLDTVVLLGMGGSSLGPEVIRRTFGELEGAMRLHVLDSTDPGAVLALERSIDLERTVFLVSSKSGGTIETLSQFRYFHGRVEEGLGQRAGSRFVAITDPGTPLAELARRMRFRHIFENPADIGGRYSVMSYFGLVPAVLAGVPIESLLHRCQVGEQSCASFDAGAQNTGLWLGVAAGEAALNGRDKLTFCISEPLAGFGLWVEQLIAESTGKLGRGIVPVVDEPRGEPEAYGDDRAFAYLRHVEGADTELDEWVAGLERAGQLTFTLSTHGPTDLGRAFFLAEFATAVAGWTLGINPFDQPNVQEAKDSTNRVLDRHAVDGALPPAPDGGAAALLSLLMDAAPPRYVALMGYMQPSERIDAAVAELRLAILRRTGCATTFGYGPRFLHSTGQLHKGGPATGLFLQLLHDGEEDVAVPGAGYSFATLKNAQALGDFETLRGRGLPAERVRLDGDAADELLALAELVGEGG